MILINDEKQAALYKDEIEPNLEAGNMLMFLMVQYPFRNNRTS